MPGDQRDNASVRYRVYHVWLSIRNLKCLRFGHAKWDITYVYRLNQSRNGVLSTLKFLHHGQFFCFTAALAAVHTCCITAQVPACSHLASCCLLPIIRTILLIWTKTMPCFCCLLHNKTSSKQWQQSWNFHLTASEWSSKGQTVCCRHVQFWGCLKQSYNDEMLIGKTWHLLGWSSQLTRSKTSVPQRGVLLRNAFSDKQHCQLGHCFALNHEKRWNNCEGLLTGTCSCFGGVMVRNCSVAGGAECIMMATNTGSQPWPEEGFSGDQKMNARSMNAHILLGSKYEPAFVALD